MRREEDDNFPVMMMMMMYNEKKPDDDLCSLYINPSTFASCIASSSDPDP